MKNSFFKITRIIILILGILSLYFSTHFWIGSREQYYQLKKESLLLLFFNRFLLNTIVIGIFLVISFLFSKILGKNMPLGLSLKRVIRLEALVLFSISIILILIKILFEDN